METESSKSESNANFDNARQFQNETACSESSDVKFLNCTYSRIQILNSHNGSTIPPDVFATLNEQNSRPSDSSTLGFLNLSNSEIECNNSPKVKSRDFICADAVQYDSESHESISPESLHIFHPVDSEVISLPLKPNKINSLGSVQYDVVDQNKIVSATPAGQQVNNISRIGFPKSSEADNLKEVSSGVGHSAGKFEEQDSPSIESTNNLCKSSSDPSCAKNGSRQIRKVSTDKPPFLNEPFPDCSDANCSKCSTADSPARKESLTLDTSSGTTDIVKSGDLKISIDVSPTQEESKTPFKDGKPDVPGDPGTNSVSNLSPVGDLESTNEVKFLRRKIDDLATKLLRSQEQMEALLEEKQKWLMTCHQQQQQSSKHKSSVSPDTAAVVVKFAQVGDA